MKIRTGFVSNSSSSSFLIYGVYNPDNLPDEREDIINLVKKEWMKEAWQKWYQEKLQTDWAKEHPEYYPKDITYEQYLEDNIYEDEEYYYIFSEIMPIFLEGFEYHDPYGYGDHYFGVCPKEMDNNMTMGEWKAKVETMLKEILGDNIKCDWHEYAWRDG